jgi:hypothetical protein
MIALPSSNVKSSKRLPDDGKDLADFIKASTSTAASAPGSDQPK